MKVSIYIIAYVLLLAHLLCVTAPAGHSDPNGIPIAFLDPNIPPVAWPDPNESWYALGIRDDKMTLELHNMTMAEAAREFFDVYQSLWWTATLKRGEMKTVLKWYLVAAVGVLVHMGLRLLPVWAQITIAVAVCLTINVWGWVCLAMLSVSFLRLRGRLAELFLLILWVLAIPGYLIWGEDG